MVMVTLHKLVSNSKITLPLYHTQHESIYTLFQTKKGQYTVKLGHVSLNKAGISYNSYHANQLATNAS